MTKNAEIIQNPNYTFSVWVGNTLVSDGWKRRSDAEAEAEIAIRMIERSKIKITEHADFATWGEWRGDQIAALHLISEIPGYAGNAELYNQRGHAAGDNSSEGTFYASSKTAEEVTA